MGNNNALSRFVVPQLGQSQNVLAQYAQNAAPLAAPGYGPWSNGRMSMNVDDTREWYAPEPAWKRAIYDLNAGLAYRVGNGLDANANLMKWGQDVLMGRGPDYYMGQASQIMQGLPSMGSAPLDVTVYPNGDVRNQLAPSAPQQWQRR